MAVSLLFQDQIRWRNNIHSMYYCIRVWFNQLMFMTHHQFSVLIWWLNECSWFVYRLFILCIKLWIWIKVIPWALEPEEYIVEAEWFDIEINSNDIDYLYCVPPPSNNPPPLKAIWLILPHIRLIYYIKYDTTPELVYYYINDSTENKTIVHKFLRRNIFVLAHCISFIIW